jgi:hypothetical protein
MSEILFKKILQNRNNSQMIQTNGTKISLAVKEKLNRNIAFI